MIAVLLLLGVAFLPLTSNGQAQRGPSTAAERTRAVEVAKALRANPLSPTIQSDREWLVKWVIVVPDNAVPLCASFLGDLGKNKDKYSGALTASMIASETSFVIEHPDKSGDKIAIFFAGVDGTLDSYHAIQQQDGKYHLAHMDEALHEREQGKLEEYVRSTAKGCNNKK